MQTKRELTAPCGIDCFNCQIYKDVITDEFKNKLAVAYGIAPKNIPCSGCRALKGTRVAFDTRQVFTCDTYTCVTDRGHEFCFECADFPCNRLQPTADRAETFPHNMKVFNLCRMKAVGPEKWAEEEAALIRLKYYKGKLVIGKGPVIE